MQTHSLQTIDLPSSADKSKIDCLLSISPECKPEHLSSEIGDSVQIRSKIKAGAKKDETASRLRFSIDTLFVSAFVLFVLILGGILGGLSTNYASNLVTLQIETIDQIQNLLSDLAIDSESELKSVFNSSAAVLMQLIMERVLSSSVANRIFALAYGCRENLFRYCAGCTHVRCD